MKIKVKRTIEETSILITFESDVSKEKICKLIRERVNDNTVARLVHRCANEQNASLIYHQKTLMNMKERSI